MAESSILTAEDIAKWPPDERYDAMRLEWRRKKQDGFMVYGSYPAPCEGTPEWRYWCDFTGINQPQIMADILAAWEKAAPEIEKKIGGTRIVQESSIKDEMQYQQVVFVGKALKANGLEWPS